MAVFSVLSRTSNPYLDNKIKENFPAADIYKVADNSWLVSAELTARQLTEKLGIVGTSPLDPQLASVIIISISSYYGRYSAEVWEWLKLKMENSTS